MDVTEWANSSTTLNPRDAPAGESPIRQGLDAIQAHLFAKVRAHFDDQNRREEMQWNTVPQHHAWLLMHRDVIVQQHFQSGPLRSLCTVSGTDPEVTLRLADIVLESVEAMVAAGEAPAFVTTTMARLAAGLEPEG